jgi:hypothetical protein
MSPVTHGLISWLVANVPGVERGGRRLIVLAGLAPDLDGLGIIVQLATAGSEHPLEWFSEYHHRLTHNALAAVVCAGSCAWWGRSWMIGALSLAAFHLHLLCDLIGGRGPDGYQWPIPYFQPFASGWEWTWSGQWALNAPPNVVITAGALLACAFLACQRGFSPVELVWPPADPTCVATLRRWFRHPTTSSE